MTDIREGLRELLGVHTGSDADTDTVGRMNAALSGAEVVLRIGPERTRLEGREGVDHVIARIGQAVMTAQADGSWERLKVCRNDDCRWAFFDASRNRSGVWCDMGLCGSQAKVRAYRQRRSAGG
jgi:predicted RNA-binding Zn ribbon-like protein